MIGRLLCLLGFHTWSSPAVGIGRWTVCHCRRCQLTAWSRR